MTGTNSRTQRRIIDAFPPAMPALDDGGDSTTPWPQFGTCDVTAHFFFQARPVHPRLRALCARAFGANAP